MMSGIAAGSAKGPLTCSTAKLWPGCFVVSFLPPCLLPVLPFPKASCPGWLEAKAVGRVKNLAVPESLPLSWRNCR